MREGKAIGGNATDRAALEFAAELHGGRPYLHSTNILPFTSDNKMMASIVSGGWNATLVKGAPRRSSPIARNTMTKRAA